MSIISKSLTGHIYYNSPYESDDNCGTCNGGNCDYCKEEYRVSGIDKVFKTLEEAQASEKEIDNIIPEGYNTIYISDQYFFIKDDKLFIHLWTDNGYEDIQCNEQASMYQQKLEDTKHKLDMYKKCICLDKDNNNDSNPCNKYGCNDRSCFHEMKYKGRKEKKWYL